MCIRDRHYIAPACLEIGLISGNMDGYQVRVYDKERMICDCLRSRNKMDKEIFNKAIQNYIADHPKNIPRLLEDVYKRQSWYRARFTLT